MAEPFNQIEEWAGQRGLLSPNITHAQMLKLSEEVGELAAAIGRGTQKDIENELGDCVVVLTILAAQQGLTLEDCAVTAYNKIRHRKGKLINGVWVREAK
jgi:NTP pyrophosphatase (non-canonical NTP hydrolase)